jgi:tetratricopeptide (TPR) repeat protein
MLGAQLKRLFNELRRRRIFGAVAAYAFGAWFLIEVASVVLSAFEAPPWMLRAFIIAAVVGAPVAMLVAWVFDLTPRGFVRTEELPEASPAQVPAVPGDGAPRGDAQPATPGIGPERRQVTVLHAAVRVRQQDGADFDPEIEREVVPLARAACIEAARSYAGLPGVAIGNDVAVYFGIPRAHEDDAIRGARAGLAMIDAVARLNRAKVHPEVRLEARVTMHTGVVVVESPATASGDGPVTMTGEAVNWPAAMQVYAGPDQLIVTAATLRLLGGQAEVEDLGERALGDRAVARLHRIVALRAREARHGREEGLTLVGRERELALLEEKWLRSRAGAGQAVLVSGEPGIGKSRVVQSVESLVDQSVGARVLTAQCSPYHQERSLFPVAAMVQRDLLALEPDKTEAERIEALEAMLRERGWDLAETMPLLGPLLSLNVSYPPLQLAPERQQQLLLEQLVALLLETAEVSPVLVVVEDLHWADDGTLRLIGMLIDQLPTSRILMLLTHRPEFVPAWTARTHVSSLAMDRLPEREAELIVARVAAGSDLPPHVVRRIVERADGVPLFVEELTKALLEAGAGATEAGSAEIAVPATLQDSLAARLDRLGAAKRLAQIAATIGREFSRPLLAAVADLDDASLDRQLDALVEGEFVHRRGVGARARFVFKHALIQDAAYGTLLKASRRDYHGRIAEALVAGFPQVCEAQPELVALHFSEAALYEQAVTYGIAAARSAARRSANGEAVQHLRRCLQALERLPAGLARNRSELAVQMMLMPALVATRGYGAQELEQTCSRALELCGAVGDSPEQVFAVFGLWMFHVVRANHGRSVELAHRFRELALASGDDHLLVEAELIMGIAHFFIADFATAVRHFDECGRRYDRERHRDHAFRFGQDPQTIAWSYLSWIYWLQGDADGAIRTSRSAVDHARRLEHPLTLSFALSFAAWLRVYQREATEARSLTDEVLELCTLYGIEVFLAHGRVLDAWLKCDADGGAAALTAMSEAIAYFRSIGARCFLPLWEAQRAMIAAAAGDPVIAEQALGCAVADRDASGEVWAEPELERARASLLRLQGAGAAAVEGALRAAIASAERRGAPAWRQRAEQALMEFQQRNATQGV